MRWSLVVALALTPGCGDRSANPPKGPPLETVAGAPAPARVSGATAVQPASPGAPAIVPPAPLGRMPEGSGRIETVGHLERRDRLAHLFESLARLDEGRSDNDVRILQFGDSHTASDLGTSAFRRALQMRFGDGGRGFVSLGKPWKTYVQDGVHGGMTDGFEPVRVKSHEGVFYGVDGCYGLLGVGIGASRAGERAWTEVAAQATRLELDYWRDPNGGSFDVYVDGAAAGRVVTRADQGGSGYSNLAFPDAPHQIELRTVGDGDVRVFGMALDREQAGVVVDALGINGAEVFTPMRWNEAHFADQLRHRAPDLVVLAYGTNESLEGKLSDADYQHALVELLGRVARATPEASCLLLGPPDLATRLPRSDGWATIARIGDIVQQQRLVAQAAGCAFYDELGAMGGPGSMVAWAAESPPRAAKDHVHFTRSGYTQLGNTFAEDLIRAYDAWRAERGLPPATAPRTWGVATR